MFIMNNKITSLSDNQREMRSAFLGGFAGQLIAGLLWLGAAGISVLTSLRKQLRPGLTDMTCWVSRWI